MASNFIPAIHAILTAIGIQPHQLKILHCQNNGPDPQCTIQMDKSNQRQTSSMEELFEVLEGEARRQRAPNRGDNIYPIFTWSTGNAVLIDADQNQGSDGVLYRLTRNHPWIYAALNDRFLSSPNNKIFLDGLRNMAMKMAETDPTQTLLNEVEKIIRSGPYPVVELLKFIEARGEDFSPSAFSKHSPFFESKRATNHRHKSPFVGPFDEVRLRQTDRAVPWSNPLLLTTWDHFLRAKGMDTTTEVRGKAVTTTYRFADTPVLQMQQEGSKDIVFSRLRPSSGTVMETVTIPVPEPPFVSVGDPPQNQGTACFIDVFGTRIPVECHFKSTLSRDQRRAILRNLGEGIQRMDDVMSRPLITSGLKIVLGPKKVAVDQGLLDANDLRPIGTYTEKGSEKIIWLELSDTYQPEPYAIAHEAGHGYHSANPSLLWAWHYADKFQGVLPIDDVLAYDQAIITSEKIPNRDITYYWSFVKKHFVSEYAAESLYGILYQMESPHEDVAEVFMVFNSCLAVYGLPHPSSENISRVRQKCFHQWQQEALLKAVGLDYLFREFDVLTIDGIPRAEVYTPNTFQKLTGVQVNRQEVFDFIIDVYQAAIRKNPRNPIHYWRLAQAYIEQEQPEKAKEALTEYLKLQSNDQAAQRLWDSLATPPVLETPPPKPKDPYYKLPVLEGLALMFMLILALSLRKMRGSKPSTSKEKPLSLNDIAYLRSTWNGAHSLNQKHQEARRKLDRLKIGEIDMKISVRLNLIPTRLARLTQNYGDLFAKNNTDLTQPKYADQLREFEKEYDRLNTDLDQLLRSIPDPTTKKSPIEPKPLRALQYPLPPLPSPEDKVTARPLRPSATEDEGKTILSGPPKFDDHPERPLETEGGTVLLPDKRLELGDPKDEKVVWIPRDPPKNKK